MSFVGSNTGLYSALVTEVIYAIIYYIRRHYNGTDCISNVDLLSNCVFNSVPTCTHARALEWRHNGRDGVSNHQHADCLLKRLSGRRSKKTSKLRVTGLCARNSPGTGEFRTQMASNAENVSIWWRHHGISTHCDYRDRSRIYEGLEYVRLNMYLVRAFSYPARTVKL